MNAGNGIRQIFAKVFSRLHGVPWFERGRVGRYPLLKAVAMVCLVPFLLYGQALAQDGPNRLRARSSDGVSRALKDKASLQLESTSAGGLRIQAKRDRAAKRPKLVQRLDSRLIDAWEQAAAVGVERSAKSLTDSRVRTEGANVIVIVQLDPKANPTDVAALIVAQGGTVVRTGEAYVKALVPILVLEQIATLPGVSLVQPPDLLKTTAVTTEGRAATLASAWRAVGLTGQGVKVAVIDTGFSGLGARKASGEIPASAIEIDFSGTGVRSGTSVHGCGCAEIVCDMAPNAQLYLIKALDASDAEAAKNYCKAQGIQIISASFGLDNQNFYDGVAYGSVRPHPVTIVNDAAANGILWVNAAGNEQTQHAMTAWRDGDANNFLDWTPAAKSYRPYNELFEGPGSIVPINTTITGYLTWNAWPTTDQDFELLLYYWNGTTWIFKESSENAQNGTQPPRETLSYKVTTAGTLVENYAFFIKKYRATRSPTFILRSYPYDLFYYGYDNYLNPSPGSIACPGDAASSFTVGAIRYANYTTGPINYFSSLGPNNGSYTGNPVVKKPDICGPDSVSTESYGAGGFAGTSAATPHVAGLAALVKGVYPSYTPAQIRSFIEANGYDLGTRGKDNTYGSGAARMPAPPPPGGTLGDAVDAPSLPWTTGGNANWFGQTATTHDGIDAAKSGSITHNQQSWMQTTVTGPGTISFWWKVSSESNYDRLRFYVDGVEQAGVISGEVNWQPKSYSIPSGNHTLKWEYSKDVIDSIGADCGWVDQVVWTPSTAASPVHRFWSDQFGAHFYIMGDSERDRIAAKYPGTWKYETAAWYAYPSQVAGTQPVHRFWSDQLGKHFYIMGDSERDRIISKYWGIWNYEAVAWYAHPNQVAGSAPVGRFWSDQFMGHFYIITQPEIDRIAGKYSGIWNYETVAYWAFTSAPRLSGGQSFASAGQVDTFVGEDVRLQKKPQMDVDATSIVSNGNMPDFDVVYPLTNPNSRVSAQVYDSITEQWTCVLAVTNSPSIAVLKSIKPGRSYLVEVFANNASEGKEEFTIVHRSWFDSQLDPPDTLIGENDTAVTFDGTAGVGSPTLRIRIPAETGTQTVKLYSSKVGVVQTLSEVSSGETFELPLPESNRWYWIGGWRETDNSLVLSIWLRHEIEE